MVMAAMVRITHPAGTSFFSVLNVILSIWVLLSPFVFGYEHDTYRLINTLFVGIIVLGSSLLSLSITKSSRNRAPKMGTEGR